MNTATVWVRRAAVVRRLDRRLTGARVVAGTTVADATVPPVAPVVVAPVVVEPVDGAIWLVGVVPAPAGVDAVPVGAAVLEAGTELPVGADATADPAGAGDGLGAELAAAGDVVDEAPVDAAELVDDDPDAAPRTRTT